MCFALNAEEIAIGDYVSNYSGGEWTYSLTSVDGRWNVVYYVQETTLDNGKVYGKSQLKDSYAQYVDDPLNPMLTPKMHNFSDASFSVNMDAEAKTGTITAMFVSSIDGKTYQLSYSGKMTEEIKEPDPEDIPDPETSMDADEKEEDLRVVLPADGCIPWTQPKVRPNEIEVRIETDTMIVNIAFQVSIDDFDDTTYAPAGEYAIRPAREVGTVYAGKGCTQDGYTYVGTYALRLNEEGVASQAWYIVSGTVTVERNGSSRYIHLTGENSNGKVVEIIIGEEPTEGIHSATQRAIATKRMVGGQVVIERNKTNYTINGIEL